MDNKNQYDIIVVGAGHAGCEAAHAAAQMGLDTLLLTLDPAHVALMSCNPSVGGLAKGHLTREIDALGGVQALATDATGIQFRMLNTRKGPAVQAPRAQCDKLAYNAWMRAKMNAHPRITVLGGMATDLIIEKGEDGKQRVAGVIVENAECGLRNAELNTGSADVPSAIQSQISNLKSHIPDSQSAIRNPQSKKSGRGRPRSRPFRIPHSAFRISYSFPRRDLHHRHLSGRADSHRAGAFSGGADRRGGSRGAGRCLSPRGAGNRTAQNRHAAAPAVRLHRLLEIRAPAGG